MPKAIFFPFFIFFSIHIWANNSFEKNDYIDTLNTAWHSGNFSADSLLILLNARWSLLDEDLREKGFLFSENLREKASAQNNFLLVLNYSATLSKQKKLTNEWEKCIHLAQNEEVLDTIIYAKLLNYEGEHKRICPDIKQVLLLMIFAKQSFIHYEWINLFCDIGFLVKTMQRIE